jgi:anti-sigma B factor antagonist
VTLETHPGGTSIVRVNGELDMATTPELQEVVDRVEPAGKLVIDLTSTTFLDSSAVRLLVATARASGEAGGAVSLVASDAGILRVLEIAAVDTMLPVHPTLEAAL